MGLKEDLFPILTKRKLRFVEKKQESDDVFTFTFQSDEPIEWKAGQHGMFSVNEKIEGRSWRVFSIASSPHENEIKISMHIPKSPSSFKAALSKLTPGDLISMRGPFGSFYFFDLTTPILLVAGGIGITPMRSLLYQATQHNPLPRAIHLLYSQGNSSYPYRDEIDQLVTEHRFLTVDYLGGRDELSEKVNHYVNQHGNDSYYYLSGPQAMVKSLKQALMHQGIHKKNIKHDPFVGY